MDHKTVEEYILSLPNARLDYPFGKDVAVYKFIPPDNVGSGENHDAEGRGNPDVASANRGKMFALISEGKTPVRLSLKCDPELSKVLREKYETVLEGYHLNKKHWNTIVLTGQLPWEEIQDLIRHSYDLVAKS
ncbi:MAG TPA: MmcQ/YjbR family DNA-binding protein [Candidatus Saccharimonadales bacterium]|nr:MmcQ/YjbR family DNA-binding protein [Candidatus Saccharimonadales bacterium]